MIPVDSKNGHAANGRLPPLSPAVDGGNPRPDHGPDGRFTKGNRAGVGNPFARRVATLRGALLAAVTEDDMHSVARKLVEQARAGDVPSAKLLWEYCLGRPAPVIDPDRLELDEWALLAAAPQQAELLFALMSKDPALAVDTLQRVRLNRANRLEHEQQDEDAAEDEDEDENDYALVEDIRALQKRRARGK
jgi:hypothetical protein